jgi:hypothetical protein
MENPQLSLIDNDFTVQAKTDFQLNDREKEVLAKFISRMKETLTTGETAFLEVSDARETPVTFEVSLSS